MTEAKDFEKPMIKILNEKTWKDFHECSTEMVLTKSGRKLFPRLQYRITGLEPKKRYLVELQFRLVDNKKYKFKQGGWAPTECCEPTVMTQKVINQEGWQMGDFWMQSGIKFDRVKITNNSEEPLGNVLLQSMRKYQPVITVYSSENFADCVNNFCLPQERLLPVYEFSSNIQEFIAVTAYQNNRITALKISRNPYAKGFREGQNKRKRSLSSSGSTPSPENKRFWDPNCTLVQASSAMPQFTPLAATGFYQQQSTFPQQACLAGFETSPMPQFMYQQPSLNMSYYYPTNISNPDPWPYTNRLNPGLVSSPSTFTDQPLQNLSYATSTANFYPSTS